MAVGEMEGLLGQRQPVSLPGVSGARFALCQDLSKYITVANSTSESKRISWKTSITVRVHEFRISFFFNRVSQFLFSPLSDRQVDASVTILDRGNWVACCTTIP